MHSFFRYPVYDYEPVRYVVNPVRCVQAFLCLGCFALAIYLVIEVSILHVAFKIVLAVTAAAFATITIIDIISTSHYNPIFWNNWILFTMAGALFFFLCVGLLFATGTGLLPILIIAEVLNAVTGIMFLIDAIYLINTMKKRQSGVTPLKEEWAPTTGAYAPQEVCESEPEEIEEEEIPPEEPKESLTEASSKTISIQEKPSKRSTTSYGGTFPVAKDETPLPSPEERVCPGICRRKSSSSSSRLDSSSEIIETPKEGRILRGADGRMYLSDGTPLIAVQNEKGELFYQSPAGVIYTRDGIPIVPAKIICGPPLKKEMKVLKSDDQSVLSLQEYDQRARRISRGRDGRMHLSDGTLVKPIKNKKGEVLYLSSDGVLYNADGVPLASTPERVAQLQDEHLSRRSSVRVRSTTTPPETCASEDHRSQRTIEESSSRTDKRGPSRDRMGERSTATIGSQRRDGRSMSGPPETYTCVSEEQRSQRMIEESSPKIDKRPREKSTGSQRGDVCSPCCPKEQKRSEKIIVPCPAMERTEPEQTRETIIVPCPATDPFQRYPATQRSAKSRESPSRAREQSQREITADKGAVPRSTAHVEQGQVRTVYPAGQKEETQSVTSKGAVPRSSIYVEQGQMRTVYPIGQKEETQSVTGGSVGSKVKEETLSVSRRSVSSRVQQREDTQTEAPRSVTTSRTVAISTRMVPKGTAGRCRSAPGTQEEMVPKEPFRRCSKSAEEPPPTAPAVAYQYQQQQPSSIYHQYVQKQCYCGKTHYQTATTVHGNVVATSCPFYATQAVPPPKPICPAPSPTPECAGQKQRPPTPQPLKICTPGDTCGNKNCNCCSREKPPASYQPPPPPQPKKSTCVCSDLQQESERLDEACASPTGLQTISECECETDPSSTWEQENLHLQETTSDVSSIQQTSSDNVQETCDKCHTCGDERCSVHAKPPVPTDTDEVQTSETRMVRARDLQKLNQNLPGTTDSFDR